jgi:hypothetical protein
MSSQNLMGRLRARLAEMISPETAPPPAQRPTRVRGTAARAAAVAPNYEPTIGPDFEARLKQMLGRSGGQSRPGRVNVVSLAKIHARLGPAWERVAERADLIARGAIERRLAPEDVYAAWKEVNYIIAFADLSETQSHLKCRLIQEEITKALLGEQAQEGAEVKMVVTKPSGELVFEDLPSVELLLAPTAAPGGEATASGEPGAMAMIAGHGQRSAEQAAKEDVLAGLRFLFRPMWDPSKRVLSAYLCLGLVSTSDVGNTLALADMTVATDPEGMQRLDRLVLRRVIAEVTALIEQRRKVLIAAPLHFETLCSVARRREVAAALAELPPGAKELILVEIVDTPDGVPQMRMNELVAPLRPHSRAVIVRQQLTSTDFSSLKDIGVAGVGADIGAHLSGEFVVMQQMARFRAAAEKAGLLALIRGVHSRSLAAAALGSGYYYIDGDAVAPAVRHPEEIRNFELFDIYRSLASA